MEQTVARTMLDILEHKGWIKHAMHASDGHCLIGAAMRTGSGTQRPLNELIQVISEQFPERLENAPIGHSIATFNDHPATTFADVRLVLEKTDVRLQELI